MNAVGDLITGKGGLGVVHVLAKVSGNGVATCTHTVSTPALDHVCGCPIQRKSTGDLRDGVRAHYRIVHPEIGVK